MRGMRAADLMTPEPITVLPDTPIAEVARSLRDHDVGGVPVVADELDRHLVGMITDRDIAVRCTAMGHNPRTCTAKDHMSGELRTARPEDDLGEVMAMMRGGQIRRIPVVDDEERVIGIIAQADLAVDAVEAEAATEMEVAETLQRISEPGHPEPT